MAQIASYQRKGLLDRPIYTRNTHKLKNVATAVKLSQSRRYNNQTALEQRLLAQVTVITIIRYMYNQEYIEKSVQLSQ